MKPPNNKTRTMMAATIALGGGDVGGFLGASPNLAPQRLHTDPSSQIPSS
jgi:hypothetical protein